MTTEAKEKTKPELCQEARWGTHIPAMTLAVSLLPGKVLELGVGYFSTTILHNLKPEYLLSVESNPGWMARFVNQQSDIHKFRHVVDYDKLFNTIGLKWDVVLVDHAPYEQRFHDLARLKGHCGMLVVHDTDEYTLAQLLKEEKINKMQELLDSFKYRIDFNHVAPQTSILSDTIDVGSVILTGINVKG